MTKKTLSFWNYFSFYTIFISTGVLNFSTFNWIEKITKDGVDLIPFFLKKLNFNSKKDSQFVFINKIYHLVFKLPLKINYCLYKTSLLPFCLAFNNYKFFIHPLSCFLSEKDFRKLKSFRNFSFINYSFSRTISITNKVRKFSFSTIIWF